ncbi:GTPase IMAP family member GIMD1-like isoform X1 [Sander lucioperca]|uniref:GTPase IMAP family member GIMD1-like isoform X1 n=1 Tax=Sander lucioperca TaxID=283035 RepID=UPI00165397A9|nr:GTPase IMAP family member GIMD1-like isoform X1 [Sander lucioperca]
MSGTLPGKSTEPKLTIMLVGLTGVGKTSVMNTLLGIEDQKHGPSPNSQTTECKMAKVQHGDQELVIIDTTGVLNNKKSEEEVKKDIVESIAHAALDGGPHVFLLVMRSDSCSDEDKKAVEIIQEIFGDGSKDYTLVLFTRGGEYVPTHEEVEEIKFLKKFLDKDHPRRSFHSFENNDCKNVKGEEKEKQVSDLVEKINYMVAKNRKRNRSRYTSKMLEKAQEIQKEMEMSEPNDTKADIVCKTVEKFVTGVVGEPWVGLVFGIVKSAMKKVDKYA